MEDNNIVMEQENQEYNNTYEQPNYPVEVESADSSHQQDNASIGGAEIAVGGFAIAGVAAVGYGIYKGIKALINKIKGSEDEEEEEEEKPRKKKTKKDASKKKVKKAPKKKPEPEEDDDDEDYEVEESDEDTED